MIGHTVGYIRVSSFDQNPSRQLEGLTLDRVFIDKASGKDIRRPELENLKQFVRDGDTVVVHSMDRLARNLDDLRQIVRNLTVLICTLKRRCRCTLNRPDISSIVQHLHNNSNSQTGTLQIATANLQSAFVQKKSPRQLLVFGAIKS